MESKFLLPHIRTFRRSEQEPQTNSVTWPKIWLEITQLQDDMWMITVNYSVNNWTYLHKITARADKQQMTMVKCHKNVSVKVCIQEHWNDE